MADTAQQKQDKECTCASMIVAGAFPGWWCEKHGDCNTDPAAFEAMRRMHASLEEAQARARPSESFQSRVRPWMMACFGSEIAEDVTERNHRYLEESLELVQSTGCTQSEARQLVDYVYGRPVGEPSQEAGGAMVTLAALCDAHGMDMHECGETELARVWTCADKIRAKQAAKPSHSPLPGPTDALSTTPAAHEILQTVRMRLEVAHGLLDLATGPGDARAALQAILEAIRDIDGVRHDDRLSDEVRSFIEGMSVSVDVSTGEHDAGNRYFGTVTEVMDDPVDKHGVTLLVQDAKPNFAAPAQTLINAAAREPWMTSYAATPRTKDGTEYIMTTVAANGFQLYRHEAQYLYALLGAALAGKAQS
jgi:hypothetical protein